MDVRERSLFHSLWKTCGKLCAFLVRVTNKMNAWDQIKLSLAGKISTEAFQNWFVDTRLQQFDGDTISVSVPNEATKEWMEREYADSVHAIIRDLNLPIRRV